MHGTAGPIGIYFEFWCWQLEPGLEPAARWTDRATATVNLNKGFLKYKMPPNTNATSFLEQQSHEQTDIFGFSLFFFFFFFKLEI